MKTSRMVPMALCLAIVLALMVSQMKLRFDNEGQKKKTAGPRQPAGTNRTSYNGNVNPLPQHKLTPMLSATSSLESKLIPADKRESQGMTQGNPPIIIHDKENPSRRSGNSKQYTWAVSLKEIVKKVNAENQVAFLFTTYEYLDSTLNWLIAAKVRCDPPVANVVVICYDMKSRDILMKHEIPSVFINPDTLFHGKMGSFKSSTRTIVMMTVTSWGYDVVQYDADALILKNPSELFERHPDSDIVTSGARHWPPKIGEKWGFVACTGVIFYRSTPKIDFLWDVTKKKIKVGSDQKLVNEALDNFGIRWVQSGGNSEQSVDGVCKNGLKVTVLSQKDICRDECKPFSSSDKEHLPYILHRSKGEKTGKSKKSNAIEMKVWWLAEDWDSAISDEKRKGTEWLASLMS